MSDFIVRIKTGFFFLLVALIFSLSIQGMESGVVFFNAIVAQDIDTIKAYIKKVNLNKRVWIQSSSSPFLSRAIMGFSDKKKGEVIKLLLDNKVNPDGLIEGEDNRGYPLRLAIGFNFAPGQKEVEIIQMLLDYGANYGNDLYEGGNNILHIVAKSSHKKEHTSIGNSFLSLKRPLEKENNVIIIFLLCMKHQKNRKDTRSIGQFIAEHIGIRNKTYKIEVPPKPVLWKILNYAGISNKPYGRSSILSTGLLFEKNKKGKTPYDILVEKNSPLAEKFKPVELQLVIPNSQFTTRYKLKGLSTDVWSEQLGMDVFTLSKNTRVDPTLKIKSN